MLSYRHLVNVAYTEEEVKAIAAAQEVEDGPNDEGEMFMRPGVLSDYLPRPYPNEQAARAANNGAFPPDLSQIQPGRMGGENYLFQLLTSYREKPYGVELRQGLFYNPYFPDGAIGMPPPLMPGMIEYEDGTEASVSQMAKDVVAFLTWVGNPEHQQRTYHSIKGLLWGVLLAFSAYYLKRFRRSVIKTRKVIFPTKGWTA